MSDWYVVIDASGECRSLGTRVADPLPAGLQAVALSSSDAESLLDGSGVWVPASRSVRAAVAPAPEATLDQIRIWMQMSLGMTTADVEAAFREAARMC
jgi:hypothetical protein